MTLELCISCGNELNKMERNRWECWDCIYKSAESYNEELEDD